MRSVAIALAVGTAACSQILGDLGDVQRAPPTEDDGGTPDAEAGAPPPNDAASHADAAPSPSTEDCSGPLAAGDLAIVELMISSQSGAGDGGEWLEVKSTRACRLNLRGLHAESPRGPSFSDTLDVTSDVWVAPLGTFVIADTSDPTVNHDLPGLVLAWAGTPSPVDSLKNAGDSVTLSAASTTIDAVTYASLTWTAGTSLEFPSACRAEARSDWTKWSSSTKAWSGAFRGTPNAANDDVACP
jgi:hypothetical protein